MRNRVSCARDKIGQPGVVHVMSLSHMVLSVCMFVCACVRVSSSSVRMLSMEERKQTWPQDVLDM